MSVVDEATALAGLYIGGEWSQADTGRTFAVTDPATGCLLGHVQDASAADGLRAVAAANAAGPSWARTASRARGEVLRAAHDLMLAGREELARLITLESGKPIREAHAEVAYAAEFFRWYSEEAVRATGTLAPAPGRPDHRVLTALRPVGVSVLVTPWNFPAAMVTRKLAPALAAGCTTVLKPAPETPLTALAVARILEEAGALPGVVNVVPTMRAAQVVASMLEDPRVRKLSFTGSTAVGRALLGLAADSVTSCSMELGGNAPFLVMEDADVDAAVEGALVAKLRNVGELCIAANRFLVHERLADEFCQQFAAAMQGQVVGPTLDPETDVGSLIHDAACDRVQALVDDAVDRGASVLTGGGRVEGPGSFFTPTLLDAVPTDAKVVREEIFGPVAPVVRFRDREDAIRLANETQDGLAAYVFSRDLGSALATCEALQVGVVGVNRGLVSEPAAPFGGVKHSGVGREGGHEGLLAFCETQYIAASW